jgi:murein DD-endopeptidase MepM/ murein hydrolase activator NlpD
MDDVRPSGIERVFRAQAGVHRSFDIVHYYSFNTTTGKNVVNNQVSFLKLVLYIHPYYKLLFIDLMIRYLLLSCFCSIVLSVSFAQKSSPRYPQGYFRWPLNLPPQIVANMGELRNNHWHMGLDIRTNQKVNQHVYAAAEGYVAYMGIRPLSFGRFIIINHPNGYSTLYGHLNDFAPELEAYATDQQYKQESWAVELTIPKGKFPVSKGSFIAYSGTTGGSQGPHVHFEIRDTKTNECLNPLLFGMPLIDKVPPTIARLTMYDRNMSVFEQSPQFFGLKHTASGYTIPKAPTIKVKSNVVSFGLQAYDRINGSQNQDGIYSAKLFLDDELKMQFVIDSISYDETKYMNAHIDFRYHANAGPFIQHLSVLPGDRGGVYRNIPGDGIIDLNDTGVHHVRIEVEDSYRNNAVLNFDLQYEPSGEATDKTTRKSFLPNQENELRESNFEAYLPENVLYDKVPAFYHRTSSSAQYAVSDVYQLNDESVPLHDNMTIRIRPDKPIPTGGWDKLVIRRTYRNSTNVRLAKKEGEWLSAEFDDFGYFQAFADVVPPHVSELGSGDTVNVRAGRIAFTPTDNFGIKSFRAELDGKWIRFTNDKGRTWIYNFDERCPYGLHHLNVRVEDVAGNVTERQWWFKRSPYTAPKKTIKKKTSGKKKTRRK